MSIANCIRCHRMFQKTAGRRVCADCLQAEEEQFRLVRDYIEANPGCGLFAVGQGTGVDEGIVLRFLKEGRLAALGESAAALQVDCERCSKPIPTGRYCNECQYELETVLKESAKTLADAPPEKGQLGTRRPEAPKWRHGLGDH